MLCSLDIDGAAIRHNYQQFCRIVGAPRVAPVLKANAYGHGLAEVYQALALAPSPPAWICTNYVAEAARLRALGYQGRLLVVGPAVARELAEAEACRAEVVVGTAEVLAAWLAMTRPPLMHVKFDTGMARQGFLPKEAGPVAARLQPKRDLVKGICTHFANVEDVTDHAYATAQLTLFTEARAAFKAAGLSVIAHAASSAAALIMDESRLDLARVGISLYGVWPSPLTRVSYLQLTKEVLELKPALSWRAEVTTVKAVEAGHFIGYGCTFRAIRDMRVAVLPVGYFEGYPRLAGENPAYVLVRGQRCPLVGRICMNMMMADVTHVPAVKVGDLATLIGNDGSDHVSAQDVATWARTIHYELLARLHPDIPRRLAGG